MYAYHAKWIAESPEKYQTAIKTQISRRRDQRRHVRAGASRDERRPARDREAFTTVYVLVMPTMKGTAPVIGSRRHQHVAVRLVRTAGHLRPVGVFERRSANRIADRRRTVERNDRHRARTRVRGADRVAQAKASALAGARHQEVINAPAD
jgi:hypothetical protein